MAPGYWGHSQDGSIYDQLVVDGAVLAVAPVTGSHALSRFQLSRYGSSREAKAQSVFWGVQLAAAGVIKPVVKAVDR